MAQLIEVRVGDVPQLFDERDPSPLQEKDLNQNVDKFIVDWARILPGADFQLRIHLERCASVNGEQALADAIGRHFGREAEGARRRLRRLFHLGRISLLIGLVFLAATTITAELLTVLMADSRLGRILGDSVLIGGWVAMWRPLEIFLYDWWPIRGDIRLFEGLSRAPVEIVCGTDLK